VFRLKYDPAAEAAHDALPPRASAALTRALAASCRDPIRASRPYGADDRFMRMVVTDEAFGVLLVGHDRGTVTVLQLNYLGRNTPFD
jgi:hypothetical protein